MRKTQQFWLGWLKNQTILKLAKIKQQPTNENQMKSYRITVSISHDPCSLAIELALCNLLEVEPNTAHSVSSNVARDSPYASTKSNSLSLPSYRGLILLMLLELSTSSFLILEKNIGL